mgnify:CR=1 FL=1
MRLGKVVGKVTLNRCHPSYIGTKLRLVVPLALDDLPDAADPQADTLVVWDEIGTGEGCIIAIIECHEASHHFRTEVKAGEAYASALIDELRLDQGLVDSIRER